MNGDTPRFFATNEEKNDGFRKSLHLLKLDVTKIFWAKIFQRQYNLTTKRHVN